ncbi:uncharacterized protein LOC130707238 isoform X2 [Balaenoptera acutorostrata]|uniref:Uncharacterized protein LOC130707238 isoform X2 n=1 Tax=Balaenoptera acutorostrata TaxID=9767 RepID=A0ABM3T391_BALAC|nr:uncharacterized protein LOC130707238 isoform X2 [Balaenoptera acutorostrata]
MVAWGSTWGKQRPGTDQDPGGEYGPSGPRLAAGKGSWAARGGGWDRGHPPSSRRCSCYRRHRHQRTQASPRPQRSSGALTEEGTVKAGRGGEAELCGHRLTGAAEGAHPGRPTPSAPSPGASSFPALNNCLWTRTLASRTFAYLFPWRKLKQEPYWGLPWWRSG